MSLPHSVRHCQDTQAEEVNGQQQVDILLRKHLHWNTQGGCAICAWYEWRGAQDILSYLEEEVEAKQSAAGDDGKPSGILTCDGLWHVWSILGGDKKQNDSDVSVITERTVHNSHANFNERETERCSKSSMTPQANEANVTSVYCCVKGL